MKKLLSLFCALGLLAFVAMPIYAQEEDADVENVVVEAENIVDEAVDAVDEAVDDTAEFVDEAVDETVEFVDDTADAIDEATDLEEISDFSALLESDEVQDIFGELDVNNEEGAGIIGLIAGLLAGLGIAGGIIGLIWLVLVIVAMWKIFEKAGEAGWKAIIPIYNIYILYKIVGMKNWFWYTIIVAVVCGLIGGFAGEEAAGILTGVSSLFSGIVGIVAAFKLPRKFGWGVFTSILYVLFTCICILILGFGNYKYEGKSDETVVEA